MSAPNINDPASISALLEQLKSSTAWQQLASEADIASAPATSSSDQIIATSSAVEIDTGQKLPSDSSVDLSGQTATTSPSVAELLSQLNSVSEPPVPARSRVTHRPNAPPSYSVTSGLLSDYGLAQNNGSHPSAFPRPNSDVRNLTFTQSLPLISQLAEDPAFLSALAQMKTDQDELEKKLWQEREAIYSKYHSKFKTTQTKANLIGTSVSQHEIDMMTDSFNKEIARFDVDRVLPAWDGLVSRQQQEMAQLRLPTMFLTTEKEDRERQQKVINVLESIVGSKTS